MLQHLLVVIKITYQLLQSPWSLENRSLIPKVIRKIKSCLVRVTSYETAFFVVLKMNKNTKYTGGG